MLLWSFQGYRTITDAGLIPGNDKITGRLPPRSFPGSAGNRVISRQPSDSQVPTALDDALLFSEGKELGHSVGMASNNGRVFLIRYGYETETLSDDRFFFDGSLPGACQ